MRKLYLLALLLLFVPLVSAWYYPEDGLMSFWDFDETTGDAVDIFRGIHNGTIPNENLTRGFPGVEGTAYYFNVTGSVVPVVNVTDHNDLDFDDTGNMTLSFWIKTTDATSASNIFRKRGNVGDRSYNLFVTKAAGLHQINARIFEADADQIQLDSASTYNLTNYTHIVMTTNGTDFKLYVNGTETDYITYDGTIDPSTVNLLIGSVEVPFGNFSLDEVGLWNRTLTDTEILDLFDDDVIENSRTFTASTYDTLTETFTINVTYDNETFSSIDATLVYNSSRYSSTKVGSNQDFVFTSEVALPSLDAEVNNTFYWEFTLTNTTGTQLENSTNSNQTVVPATIINCTSGTIALNITTYNEESLATLATEMDITFGFSLNDSQPILKNFSVSNALTSYHFCINVNETFYTDVDISLNKSGYNSRTFHFEDDEYTNVTTNYQLYLLNSSLGTDVILVLKDTGLTPLEGYTIKVYRKVESTGQEILVESDKTDVFGQIVTRLVENDVKYKIEFYDTNDVLVKTISEAVVACRSTICLQQYIIEDSTNLFGDFSNLTDYTAELTFDNNTNTFSFVWVDNRDESSTHRLEVTRYLFNGTTSVCNSTSSANSGVLTCAVGSSRASYQAQAYRDSGGRERRIIVISEKVGDLVDTFGNEGLIWSFFLLMTLIIVGVFYPPVGIILYLVGVLLLGVLDIVFIDPAIIVAEIVIGVLFIWAFRG